MLPREVSDPIPPCVNSIPEEFRSNRESEEEIGCEGFEGLEEEKSLLDLPPPCCAELAPLVNEGGKWKVDLSAEVP